MPLISPVFCGLSGSAKSRTVAQGDGAILGDPCSMDLLGTARVEVFAQNGTKLELWSCGSPWMLSEGSSSGGLPDF